MTGFTDLCATLYEAVLDPTQLREFCSGLARVTGSHIGTVLIHDPSRGKGRLEILVGADVAFMRMYEREYGKENLWLQRGDGLLRKGAVVDSDSIVSRSELRRSRYYNEFLKKADIEQSVGICAYRDASSLVMATANRSGKDAPYSDDDLALMQRLAPHWVNSYAIYRQLSGVRQKLRSLEEAMHALSTAMVLLDEQQQIQRMNAAAEGLFSEGWLIESPRGVNAKGCDTRQWEQLLGGACRGHAVEGRVRRKWGKMLLRDINGHPILIAAVHPLPMSSSISPQGEEVAVLFIQRVSIAGTRSLRTSLMELYTLTPAEALLAITLLNKVDLEEVAWSCGITLATARTRLKAIFDKTGERSQVGLMRLMTVIANVIGAGAFPHEDEGPVKDSE